MSPVVLVLLALDGEAFHGTAAAVYARREIDLNLTGEEAAGTQDRYPDWQANGAPTVTAPKPSPGASTKDRTPAVSARVSDAQDELAGSDLKLYLDGKPRTFPYSASTDRLTFTDPKLSFGKHTVKVVATDSFKLSTNKQWSFKVVK